jgi:hypothetical protein
VKFDRADAALLAAILPPWSFQWGLIYPVNPTGPIDLCRIAPWGRVLAMVRVGD